MRDAFQPLAPRSAHSLDDKGTTRSNVRSGGAHSERQDLFQPFITESTHHTLDYELPVVFASAFVQSVSER